MMVPGSASPLIFGGGDPLDELGKIDRSLRFRSASSAYLSRTPGSTSDRSKWTYSSWVKRGSLGAGCLFSAYTDGNNRTLIRFNSSDQLDVRRMDATVSTGNVSTAVFKDMSAFLHVVITVDAAQAAAVDRAKIYVNGVLQALSSPGFASGNTFINLSGAIHGISSNINGADSYFDGIQSHIAFVDGLALDPTSFGSFHAITGQWRPKSKTQVKAIVDSGGPNSFFLAFDDNTNLTTLVTDSSTKGNNWTANNISLTTGVTYDSMLDTPTTNYATFNPLSRRRTNATLPTFAEGNLKVTHPNAAGVASYAMGTIGVSSGKWYWEHIVGTLTTALFFGLGDSIHVDDSADHMVAYANTGAIVKYGSTVSTQATFTNNDVIGVAYDADAATVSFYKNNVLQFTVTSLLYTPAHPFVQGNTNDVHYVNFGQRAFVYTPPSGYKALSEKNTPIWTNAAANLPNRHMDIALHTGNGTSITISGLKFSPDFVWTKRRNVISQHTLTDRARGANGQLFTALTNAEQIDATNFVTSFNSDGVTLGPSSGAQGDVNINTGTYVDWFWKAGGDPVSNSDGTISSQVSSNQAAGFSVVTYTGTGVTSRVGHGLSLDPKLIFVKSRSASRNWLVYAKIPGMASSAAYYVLNSTAAQVTGDNTPWGNQDSNALSFGIGTAASTNNSGETYVAYCFSEISGFSKIGNYMGNGSVDGPFVYCGFKPKFVMYKRTDSTGNWVINDTSRESFNTQSFSLYPNISDPEGSAVRFIDILCSGFKVRNTNTDSNASGGTYLFMAFAEAPFRYSNAR